MERLINVEGMTCKHCKMTLEGALKKLNGVSNAEVNLENKQVVVVFDEGLINFEQMKETIVNAGYNVID